MSATITSAMTMNSGHRSGARISAHTSATAAAGARPASGCPVVRVSARLATMTSVTSAVPRGRRERPGRGDASGTAALTQRTSDALVGALTTA
jgi:hypothetical protein